MRTSDKAAGGEATGLVNSLGELYNFMPPRRRRQLRVLLLLMVLGGAAELLSLGAIIPFLSVLAGGDGGAGLPFFPDLFSVIGANTAHQQLVVAASLFTVAAISATALRLLLTWTTQSFALNLGHEISVEVQRRVMLQPYAYQVQSNSSAIVASLEKVQTLIFSLILPIVQIAAATVISLFILVALAQVDLLILVIAVTAIAAIYAVWVTALRRRMQHYSSIAAVDYDRRVQMVQENLGAIRDIILDHSQGAHLARFAKVDRRLADVRAQAVFFATAPRFVIEGVGMVLIAALAIIIWDREGGLASALPILGAFALGAQRLLPLMQQFYQGWSNFAANRSIIGQVLTYLRLPVDEGDLAESVDPLTLEHKIELRNVSFRYTGRDLPALHDVSLTIPKGVKVALTGATGSGKSTLADIIMGLLEPTSGEILIDNVALSRSTRRAWRRCIAHVPQNLFLADTTVSRNIAFGQLDQNIDIDRIRDSAKVAQLDEFIETLPDRYDTRVGERGVQLSGGQRQRLAIARAVYKQAPVLVLDEATNALDRATEEAVIAAVDRLGERGRTVIMIAHRESVIRHCDLVVRLENGRVAETGSYNQLFGK